MLRRGTLEAWPGPRRCAGSTPRLRPTASSARRAPTTRGPWRSSRPSRSRCAPRRSSGCMAVVGPLGGRAPAAIFGVSRQAVAKWRGSGVPDDRAVALADLAAATDVLERYVRRDRIPAVVRRPATLLGGRSLLELAEAGEHEAVRSGSGARWSTCAARRRDARGRRTPPPWHRRRRWWRRGRHLVGRPARPVVGRPCRRTVEQPGGRPDALPQRRPRHRASPDRRGCCRAPRSTSRTCATTPRSSPCRCTCRRVSASPTRRRDVGLVALGLPRTYPQRARGGAVGWTTCRRAARAVRAAGLRGVLARSAATPDGSGPRARLVPGSRSARAARQGRRSVSPSGATSRRRRLAFSSPGSRGPRPRRRRPCPAPAHRTTRGS